MLDSVTLRAQSPAPASACDLEAVIVVTRHAGEND
jgi:hypothetical protein